MDETCCEGVAGAHCVGNLDAEARDLGELAILQNRAAALAASDAHYLNVEAIGPTMGKALNSLILAFHVEGRVEALGLPVVQLHHRRMRGELFDGGQVPVLIAKV